MKSIIICILILSSNMVKSQHFTSITYSNYCYIDSMKDMTLVLKLGKDNLFELIMDSRFNCTPDYIAFGKGKFSINKDSLTLVCDSIPNLKSAYTIDSIDNLDNTIDIQLRVIDQEQKPITNLTLDWGKPKKKGQKITPQFFTTQFDSRNTINFQRGEKINFLRVEKEGYYEQEINLSQICTKDYSILIELRPKPHIQSRSYISNKEIKLKIISSTNIEFQPKIYLKKCNQQ